MSRYSITHVQKVRPQKSHMHFLNRYLEFSPIGDAQWASFTVKAAKICFHCRAQCMKTNSGLNCQAGDIVGEATLQWKTGLQPNVSRWNSCSVWDETAAVCILSLKASMTTTLEVWHKPLDESSRPLVSLKSVWIPLLIYVGYFRKTLLNGHAVSEMNHWKD